MTLPVHHHERVERVLEESYQWWANHRSQEQAARWFNGFMDALEALGDNPDRFALAPENEEFPYEVRQLNYGLGSKPTHRALYTIRPDMVYVFLIRHLAQGKLDVDQLDS
mgnify:CR=1 FL=1